MSLSPMQRIQANEQLLNEQSLNEQLLNEQSVTENSVVNLEQIGEKLAGIMSHCPFVILTNTTFHYEQGEMVGRVAMHPELIGNVNFQILHGGVSATILDTLGGLVGMFEIYKQGHDTFEEQTKKALRLATVDLRIDYLAPGKGKAFIATAEIIRMGRKGCTTRMLLINDEGKKIAHGLASYAF